MLRKPDWLKVKLGGGEEYNKVIGILKDKNLHTVCQEANCPNMGECFCRGTATFMILGDICTRNCKYCNVKNGKPLHTNPHEPKQVAEAVRELGLKYVVITSVTRDDLKDYGAMTFAKTIKEIRNLSKAKIEVLTPDFKGDSNSIRAVLRAEPDVFGHNIETVERLFDDIRPKADFKTSIIFLKRIKEIDPKQITKSGLMIGLGETDDEIMKTMRILRLANVDILTIGQYLQPRKDLAEVQKYYTPEEFKKFERLGYEIGFKHVESAPLVRSSYHAGDYS
ncbi:MAG: lipoyl synthase [Nanoarchaeota archaeon]|nr:lipoyl synthase [Nanoarchaeota archaeon]MBU1004842.1 lipoyl synthase [Nanoarchaeota archaeon]MBU1946780.1 lipoyl synthase [Nanoarchaeota archaeon]